MGLGGHLVWSAVLRELNENDPDKKITFHYKKSLKEIIKRKKIPQPEDSEIFLNNPRLTRRWQIKRQDKQIRVFLNQPQYNYFSYVDSERFIWKKPGHMIEIVCRSLGIQNKNLMCEFYFTKEEIKKSKQFAKDLGKFIVVEPNTKDSFTLNKRWFFDRWQKVVNYLGKEYTIVQLGAGGQPVLDNVIDLTGQMTFREAAALIAKSQILVSNEGGLPHAANAVGTQAVVTLGGYCSKELLAYPEHYYFYPNLDCVPCGLRKACPIGLECMREISPDAVVEITMHMLSNRY